LPITSLLTPVAADGLRAVWPWVRIGLEEVQAKTRPEWLPEDVYTAIKGGSAFLFTIGADDGFVIVQRTQAWDGPRLFVWIMWGRNALAQQQFAIEVELDKLAASIGVRKLRMQSPRKGWERVGWQAIETIYEREVKP
jgi:hypothetical protein